jgi:hypothetical protein
MSSPAALWRDFERAYTALAHACFDKCDALGGSGSVVLFAHAETPEAEADMRQAMRDMGMEHPEDIARRCFRPLALALRDGVPPAAATAAPPRQ